ncbi:MAG: TonB-dependent receptor [Bacteroidales bacterium]|nr:TonB-dependent receptor [Bacteroidales bacterium]
MIPIEKILSAVCLACLGLSLQAQAILVRGSVTDKDGQPVIGAAVIQKDVPGNGAVTGADGTFRLNVPEGALLTVSSIGYRSVEVPARQNLTVVLEDDNELLDEVVIVGYGVQRKSNLTGAISSVGAEDIGGRSISHLEQALQGKTPGVTLITTSAQPGAAPTVRIRGIASNGTSDPLYVVDGLLMEDISSIDPNTIESMEVLKDAASAAIYGAQAGNGVVLITTKKGTKGSGTVNYDFQYTVSSLGVKPEVIGAKEYIQQQVEADPSFSDEDVLLYIDQGWWDGSSSTDWMDVAFGKGIAKRHTVSAQGATDRGSYFLSLGSLSEDGIVRLDRDTYRRYSASLNADFQVKPWLKVGATADFANYKSTPMSDGYAISGAGWQRANVFALCMNNPPYIADTYAPDALPGEMQLMVDQGRHLYTDADGNYYSAFIRPHPLVAMQFSDRINTGNRLSGTLFANFMPVKGLVVTSRLGYKVYGDHTYYYIHAFYGGRDSLCDPGSTALERTNTSTTYYQWENFANYSKTLGRHTFGGTLGMSYSHNRRLYDRLRISSTAKDDPLYADIRWPSGDSTRELDAIEVTGAKLSYFGRLNYSFADRYLLEATMRADAADLSVLPRTNRWGYFPSVSAGWIVSKEEFFSPLSGAVSFLKVRASWGQNGSTSNLTDYKYSNSIKSDAVGYSFSQTNFDYQTSTLPMQLYNPDLKWETSEQTDLGLDARFLRDRLSLTLDWFRKDTKDLIINEINVPLEAGNKAAPVNGGNIRNQGLEVELAWKDQVGDFFYSVSGNIATLKNKVTWLNPNVSDSRVMSSQVINHVGAVSAFEEGYPIWYFRGYEVEKLDENGDPVFRNLSGDEEGVIDDQDRTMIGKPLPDFTYGFTLTAGWKGLDLTVFANGAEGNDVFMAYNNNALQYGLKALYDQRWTPTNTNARYARPQSRTENIQKYMMSDAFIFDGSYFRIKQIQLGYTLPQGWTRKIAVDRLRLYASLDNYFLFTKYPGLDPEISKDAVEGIGLDFGAYPTTRKMVFGVSVTF